jgi:hypothetical protein
MDLANASRCLALLEQASDLLDELREGTLAAHLSLVTELLREKIALVGGALASAPDLPT